jgi:hypothetical protein
MCHLSCVSEATEHILGILGIKPLHDSLYVVLNTQATKSLRETSEELVTLRSALVV